MKLLAISGSTRTASTNTAMLECLCQHAPADMELSLYRGIVDLPVFSPDLEGANTPIAVRDFIGCVRQADGIVLASPEYVRAIPGGLKNAIDWLVSGDAIIGKPIVLAHASHRGDDMLASLRLVLATVSQRFNADLFLRFPLMSKSPEEVRESLQERDAIQRVERFLIEFARDIAGVGPLAPVSGRDSVRNGVESVGKSVD